MAPQEDAGNVVKNLLSATPETAFPLQRSKMATHPALDERQSVVTIRPTWPNVLNGDHQWEILFDEVLCDHCGGSFKTWEHFAACRLYDWLAHLTKPYGEVQPYWLN